MTINLSDELFPPYLQAIVRGDTQCPHCQVSIDSANLISIETVEGWWKKWKWRSLPYLEASINRGADDGYSEHDN